MIDNSIFENKKALYHTLGCKLNFAETSAIGKQLFQAGVRRVRDGEIADICVVNTCSVTDLADKKCRQIVRKLIKENPGAFVVVTGCYAQLKPEELEPLIRSCGLSKTKAKNIVNTCKILIEEYHSEVPDQIDILQTLPGVGRKTANVVASVAFGVPAIAVDTHVFRVSNRLGLAEAKNVNTTEKQLMQVIPKEKWSQAHHWLIWHGRQCCTARAPKCETCFLSDDCAEFIGLIPKDQWRDIKGEK